MHTHWPTHRTQAHIHTDTHNDNNSCPLCSPQRCIKNFQKSHLKFQNGQCSEKKYLISPLKIIIPSLTKPIPGKFVDITVPYSIDYHKYFGFDLISPEKTKLSIIRQKKKKLLCCPLPTDRKMRKNRVGFFFFFFFFFLCQIWAKSLLKFVFNGLKKHLHDLYMRFDCIPPEFSPFRNF